MKYVNVVGFNEFRALVLAFKIDSRKLVNPRVFAFVKGIRALFIVREKLAFILE
jgi:hypothetical protein